MNKYIELTEELILSMRAGARAISNTKKYHGTIYVADVFSENPKEMPYLKAAEILYAASEEKPADVAPVVQCKDCKHYEIHKPKVLENCERNGYIIPMKPDEFCSYGERKEGGDNGC